MKSRFVIGWLMFVGSVALADALPQDAAAKPGKDQPKPQSKVSCQTKHDDVATHLTVLNEGPGDIAKGVKIYYTCQTPQHTSMTGSFALEATLAVNASTKIVLSGPLTDCKCSRRATVVPAH